MTENKLRKLNRAELLEILIKQRERIDELENEVVALRSKLDNRRIALENAGSIAEASLALSSVFEEAQKAADQYLENIRMMAEEAEKTARSKEAEEADDVESPAEAEIGAELTESETQDEPNGEELPVQDESAPVPEEIGESETSEVPEEAGESEPLDEPEEAGEAEPSDAPEEAGEAEPSDAPEEAGESEPSDEPEEIGESETSDAPESTEDTEAAEETAVEVEPDAEEAPKSPAATEVAVHNAAAETPAEHKALRKSLTQIIKAYRRSKRE